ncbi:hypothetical protein Tco_1509639 [Tanacetum coccineum]
MAVLESCPKHNHVVLLIGKRRMEIAEFHEIINFLAEAPFTMLSLYITTKVAGNMCLSLRHSDKSDQSSVRESWSQSARDKVPFQGMRSLGKECLLKAKIGGKDPWTEIWMQKAPLADDTLDYMDTENAQDMGRSRFVVHEEKEREEKEVSTEGRSATPTTPTPTPTTFGDDETIAQDWETEEEKKRLAEEEATNAALIQDFDDIKARMEANRLLALRLQEEEREQFTVEERATKIPS